MPASEPSGPSTKNPSMGTHALVKSQRVQVPHDQVLRIWVVVIIVYIGFG